MKGGWERWRVHVSIDPAAPVRNWIEEATHRRQRHQDSLEHEGRVRADVFFKAPSVFYQKIGNGYFRTETFPELPRSGELRPSKPACSLEQPRPRRWRPRSQKLNSARLQPPPGSPGS